jgi:hypothetical protein
VWNKSLEAFKVEKNNTPEESQQRRKKEEYTLLCVHAPAARGAP